MIRLNAISRHYTMGDNTVHALAGVDLHIAENAYAAIMGPSGSGKTTLLNILGCMDTPSAGEYQLAGRRVSDLPDDELAAVRNRDLGFVFQSFHLLPRLTALDNVLLPLRYVRPRPADAEDRARALLDRVGLSARITHKPNELSGGQRQRVAIARALINRPKVLLADEPTGNLDSRTSQEIMALLAELHNAGQTIVLVTHEEEVAVHAQQVVRMRDGRVEGIARA